MRHGSKTVGSTLNYNQCLEICAGAQLKPVIGGSATPLNSLNSASDPLKNQYLVESSESRIQVLYVFCKFCI